MGKAKLSLPSLNIMVLLATVPALVIIGMLAIVLWVSAREGITVSGFTFKHYSDLYSDPFAYQAFFNSAKFALITVFIALAIGFPAAWLVERTDLKGKTLAYTAMTLGLLMPGFFTAMGWLLLLHPRMGTLNLAAMNLFGLSHPPINIITITGMGWVQGLSLASLAFIMMAASLRAMDPSLEEAARMSGARLLARIRRITVPLILPSITATGLYIVTIAISVFDVPAIIGLANRIFTFSTYLYYRTYSFEGVPNYGFVAAFSTFMVTFALLLSWLNSRVLVQAHKYEVVTGKGYRPKQIELGRWWMVAWLFLGGYILASKIIPLLLLIWAAGQPYLQPPSLKAIQSLSFGNFLMLPWPLVLRGLSHTIVLALGAPTFALLFSLILSWVVLRSHNPFRFAYDYVAFLPLAVPNVIFGVAALLAALFVVPAFIPLHGSLTLLLIVYSIVHLSFGSRVITSALIQIHTELEEAAYISGVRTFNVVRRVLVPLLKPALLNAWLWLFLLTWRELTLATYLASPENITISAVVWGLWDSGNLAKASAITILMMGLLLPMIFVYWRLSAKAHLV